MDDNVGIAIASSIAHLAKVLLQVEARLASIEARLADPKRGWLFQPGRLFALETIERRSGYISHAIPNGVSVLDIYGDYSQYDFREAGEGRYLLVEVDGRRVLGPETTAL